MPDPAQPIAESHQGTRRNLLSPRYGGNYLPVVLWLVGLFLLISVADFESNLWAIVLGFAFAAVVPIGALGAGMDEGHVLVLGVSAVIAGVMLVSGELIDLDYLETFGGIVYIILFLIMQYAILKDVVSQTDVTVDTIFGSVAAYMLMSMLWAYVYMVLIRFDADALVSNVDVTEIQFGDALYFSVVTQTTLGFGDIHPSSGLARAAVQFEALIGQMYIAVLVAWIVGQLVSSRTRMLEREIEAGMRRRDQREDGS